MKKTILIVVAIVLSISMLAACGKKDTPPLERDTGERNTQSPTPSPDPGERNRAPEGYYTIVSLEAEGVDVLEFYSSMGMNTDDIFIQFLSGGVVRMGVFPDSEEDIEEGTFRVNGNVISITMDGEEETGTIEGNRITLNVDGTEMVFEKNTRYSGPTFTERLTVKVTLPGSGGSFSANGSTEFTFTPNQSGEWVIETSDNGESDPYIEIYDSRGNKIASDDDSGGEYNAYVAVNLDAGATYTINVEFFMGATRSCTLTVSQMRGSSATNIPGGGGRFTISNASELSFTPNQSGEWVFETSNNGDSDPTLEIYDSRGNKLAEDDDSGDEYNAYIVVQLNAGTNYTVKVGFWMGDTGNCTLTVSQGVASVLTGNGGRVLVSGDTSFTFRPNQSGMWRFETSNNGGADPQLEIYDSRGNLLAEDDDGGDGYNALIDLQLDAGSEYTIWAMYWMQSNDSYILSVTRR